MKKRIAMSLAAFALLFTARAESSCVLDCNICLDNSTFSSVAWSNTPSSGFNVVNGSCWEGIGILSSGQPCNSLTGPTLSVFLSAPATNNITVGTITITCQVGMVYKTTSQPIQLQVAQGSQYASFQFFACQCDGNGACAVCACRNGSMYTPPANQGPQQ